MARLRFNNRQIIEQAISQVRSELSPNIQHHFDLIVKSLRNHLNNRSSRFDAPDSRKWFTVKLVPQKAIIAFRSKNRSLEFDIDTYPESGKDIRDEKRLFHYPIRPYRHKPNKVYVGTVSDQTSTIHVNYYIGKMINAIDIFEIPQ